MIDKSFHLLSYSFISKNPLENTFSVKSNSNFNDDSVASASHPVCVEFKAIIIFRCRRFSLYNQIMDIFYR